MAEVVSLHEAISTSIRDGQTVALEGFTHLIPFAAAATPRSDFPAEAALPRSPPRAGRCSSR